MRSWMWLGLFGVAGCDGGLQSVEDSTSNIDPEEPSSNIAETFGLTESGNCETAEVDGESYDVAGATSYYVGAFDISGDEVTGYEAWVLFANDTWAEGEGYDCQILWTAEGEKTDSRACSSCEYGLNLTMTMDMVGSDCVEGLKNDTALDASTFETFYNVAVSDAGETTFYFASGNPLGTGEVDGSTVTYVSDAACKWF
jgi:hypothetical protein